MGYIYLVTNRLNGKQYVGQTLRDDIELRWKEHRKICKASLGKYIYNAYLKHGIENFDFKVICNCDNEKCNDLEEEYIQKYNTISPNGYNLKSGGRNSRQHPDTIKLISERKKGVPSKVVMTPELRKIRSQNSKGEKNPNYGKKLSDEQRQKISQKTKENWKAKKEAGFVQKPNVMNAMNEALKKKRESVPKKVKPKSTSNKRSIAKLDQYGNIIEKFESMIEASKKTNICGMSISKVCRGCRKTAGGFGWKYLDETRSISITNINEKYITKQKNLFMVRINRTNFKRSKCFKTLEQAKNARNEWLKELETL